MCIRDRDMAVAPPEPGVAVSYLANITGTEIVDDYTVTVSTVSYTHLTLPTSDLV